MKRFLRYLSLIVIILLLAGWGWSLFRVFQAIYTFENETVFLIRLNRGTVQFTSEPNSRWVRYGGEPRKILTGLDFRNARIQTFLDIKDQFGLTSPNYMYIDKANYMLRIPIWLPTTLSLLIVLAMWYRPLKTLWLGTNRKGFEVDINPNVDTRNPNPIRSANEEPKL